jgi:hypothetical protein
LGQVGQRHHRHKVLQVVHQRLHSVKLPVAVAVAQAKSDKIHQTEIRVALAVPVFLL